MYERIDVWKRLDAHVAIRFQCLRRLSDGMIAVQNADSVRQSTFKTDLWASNAIFVELFLDDDPDNRCEWFGSAEEAIEAHQRDFGGPSGYEVDVSGSPGGS